MYRSSKKKIHDKKKMIHDNESNSDVHSCYSQNSEGMQEAGGFAFFSLKGGRGEVRSSRGEPSPPPCASSSPDDARPPSAASTADEIDAGEAKKIAKGDAGGANRPQRWPPGKAHGAFSASPPARAAPDEDENKNEKGLAGGDAQRRRAARSLPAPGERAAVVGGGLARLRGRVGSSPPPRAEMTAEKVAEKAAAKSEFGGAGRGSSDAGSRSPSGRPRGPVEDGVGGGEKDVEAGGGAPAGGRATPPRSSTSLSAQFDRNYIAQPQYGVANGNGGEALPQPFAHAGAAGQLPAQTMSAFLSHLGMDAGVPPFHPQPQQTLPPFYSFSSALPDYVEACLTLSVTDLLDRERLFGHIQAIARWGLSKDDVEVRVHGSLTTGLALPSSDLDLLVTAYQPHSPMDALQLLSQAFMRVDEAALAAAAADSRGEAGIPGDDGDSVLDAGLRPPSRSSAKAARRPLIEALAFPTPPSRTPTHARAELERYATPDDLAKAEQEFRGQIEKNYAFSTPCNLSPLWASALIAATTAEDTIAVADILLNLTDAEAAADAPTGSPSSSAALASPSSPLIPLMETTTTALASPSSPLGPAGVEVAKGGRTKAASEDSHANEKALEKATPAPEIEATNPTNPPRHAGGALAEENRARGPPLQQPGGGGGVAAWQPLQPHLFSHPSPPIFPFRQQKQQHPQQRPVYANYVPVREGPLFWVQTIVSTRVPVIKITEKRTGIKADITVAGGEHWRSMQLTRQLLNDHPQARALILFLKHCVRSLGIGDSEPGGVTSFAIYLMVRHFFNECKRKVKQILLEQRQAVLQRLLERQPRRPADAMTMSGSENEQTHQFADDARSKNEQEAKETNKGRTGEIYHESSTKDALSTTSERPFMSATEPFPTPTLMSSGNANPHHHPHSHSFPVQILFAVESILKFHLFRITTRFFATQVGLQKSQDLNTLPGEILEFLAVALQQEPPNDSCSGKEWEEAAALTGWYRFVHMKSVEAPHLRTNPTTETTTTAASAREEKGSESPRAPSIVRSEAPLTLSLGRNSPEEGAGEEEIETEGDKEREDGNDSTCRQKPSTRERVEAEEGDEEGEEEKEKEEGDATPISNDGGERLRRAQKEMGSETTQVAEGSERGGERLSEGCEESSNMPDPIEKANEKDVVGEIVKGSEQTGKEEKISTGVASAPLQPPPSNPTNTPPDGSQSDLLEDFSLYFLRHHLSLSQLFFDFCHYYGCMFNYEVEGIHFKLDGGSRVVGKPFQCVRRGQYFHMTSPFDPEYDITARMTHMPDFQWLCWWFVTYAGPNCPAGGDSLYHVLNWLNPMTAEADWMVVHQKIQEDHAKGRAAAPTSSSSANPRTATPNGNKGLPSNPANAPPSKTKLKHASQPRRQAASSIANGYRKGGLEEALRPQGNEPHGAPPSLNLPEKRKARTCSSSSCRQCREIVARDSSQGYRSTSLTGTRKEKEKERDSGSGFTLLYDPQPIRTGEAEGVAQVANKASCHPPPAGGNGSNSGDGSKASSQIQEESAAAPPLPLSGASSWRGAVAQNNNSTSSRGGGDSAGALHNPHQPLSRNIFSTHSSPLYLQPPQQSFPPENVSGDPTLYAMEALHPMQQQQQSSNSSNSSGGRQEQAPAALPQAVMGSPTTAAHPISRYGASATLSKTSPTPPKHPLTPGDARSASVLSHPKSNPSPVTPTMAGGGGAHLAPQPPLSVLGYPYPLGLPPQDFLKPMPYPPRLAADEDAATGGGPLYPPLPHLLPYPGLQQPLPNPRFPEYEIQPARDWAIAQRHLLHFHHHHHHHHQQQQQQQPSPSSSSSAYVFAAGGRGMGGQANAMLYFDPNMAAHAQPPVSLQHHPYHQKQHYYQLHPHANPNSHPHHHNPQPHRAYGGGNNRGMAKHQQRRGGGGGAGFPRLFRGNSGGNMVNASDNVETMTTLASSSSYLNRAQQQQVQQPSSFFRNPDGNVKEKNGFLYPTASNDSSFPNPAPSHGPPMLAGNNNYNDQNNYDNNTNHEEEPLWLMAGSQEGGHASPMWHGETHRMEMKTKVKKNSTMESPKVHNPYAHVGSSSFLPIASQQQQQQQQQQGEKERRRESVSTHSSSASASTIRSAPTYFPYDRVEMNAEGAAPRQVNSPLNAFRYTSSTISGRNANDQHHSRHYHPNTKHYTHHHHHPNPCANFYTDVPPQPQETFNQPPLEGGFVEHREEENDSANNEKLEMKLSTLSQTSFPLFRHQYRGNPSVTCSPNQNNAHLQAPTASIPYPPYFHNHHHNNSSGNGNTTGMQLPVSESHFTQDPSSLVAEPPLLPYRKAEG